MADFKLGLADLKLVSYPKGLKSIKSKLGWLAFKLGLANLKKGTYLCLFRLFYINIRYPS